MNEFMTPRKLDWKGNPNPIAPPPKAKETAEKAGTEGEKGMGKRAAKRAAKEAAKKAEKGA
jgi:tryptophanyl-tRNA synthetase